MTKHASPTASTDGWVDATTRPTAPTTTTEEPMSAVVRKPNRR